MAAPLSRRPPTTGEGEKEKAPPSNDPRRRGEDVARLLGEGGKLHDLVDDALEWGKQGEDVLVRRVADELGGRPEKWRLYVRGFLKVAAERRLARAREEVA